MEYINAKEAAQKWGIGIRRVQYFCSNGMIPGVKSMGKQWIIPADAKKPSDRRNSANRQACKQNNYHFPVYFHSNAFISPSELCNEEKELFDDAQLIFLCGDYPKALEASKAIFSKTDSSFVKIGAAYTMTLAAMLLGLYFEYKAALKTTIELSELESDYKEDFKLITADLKYTVGWNDAVFSDINIEKLSSDALAFYQMTLITASVMLTEELTHNTVSIFHTIEATAEKQGVLPTVLHINAMLASQYFKVSDFENATKCVRKCCDIALQNGWIRHISKFYVALSSPIDEYLTAVNPEALVILKETTVKNITNWKIINQFELGFSPFQNLDINDSQFLLLLAYNIPNSTIAGIIGESLDGVQQITKSICAHLNLSSREKLVEYAKMQIDGMIL